MRNNRKLLVLLLAVMLMVNCFSVNAFAVGNESPVRLYASPAAKTDSPLLVQVAATTSDVVADGKLVITYNPAILTYVETDTGAAWHNASDVTLSVNPAEGKVILAFACAEPANDGGLFTLTFRTVMAGETKVQLDGSSYVTGVTADLADEQTITVTDSVVTVNLKAGAHGVFADGSAEASVTVAEGSVLTAELMPPVTPDRGYALSGWMAEDGTVYALDELNLNAAEGMTLTAQYTFICDGVNCPSAQFVDVGTLFPEAHAAVDYMVENGYMNGMSSTIFGPHVDLNRAMMVTILYRIAGQPDASGENIFTDVPTGQFYTESVIWATENGITNGVSSTLFAPGKSLTRQELVTFLYRFAEYMGYDRTAAADLSAYTDASKVQPYAVDAFEWAVAMGVIKGTTETTLSPEATTTRAQVCLMVYRLLSAQD